VSRRSLAERIALGLARVIAGPERRRWLDALEAELDHLATRRIDWALGSLVAAVKDRARRDWTFGLALGMLPGFAVVATALFTAVSAVAHNVAGLPVMLAYLAQILAPLPFAWLLGRVRPAWPALWVGVLGFVAYQALPYITWRVLIGSGVWFFWGPTLFPLGVPVSLVLPVWLLGTWWGARAGRRAACARLGPPSSRRS
jgi:hypothetical protein